MNLEVIAQMRKTANQMLETASTLEKELSGGSDSSPHVGGLSKKDLERITSTRRKNAVKKRIS